MIRTLGQRMALRLPFSVQQRQRVIYWLVLLAPLPLALYAIGLGRYAIAPGEVRRIAGAIYVSCTGRGGAHFGAPSAELQTVRRALGDVPLVGFYAAGEIARRHLYGYTGVLTAFLA